MRAAIPAVLVEVGLLTGLGVIVWRCRRPRATDLDGNGMDDALDARLAEVDAKNRKRWEARG